MNKRLKIALIVLPIVLLFGIFTLYFYKNFEIKPKRGQTSTTIFPAKTSKKGEGTSLDTAVVVTAETESTGVRWEYSWLENNACKDNEGYQKPVGQALFSQDNSFYDVVTVFCNDNTELKYYFNIDNYFGKY